MTLITSESASQYSNTIAVTTNSKLDPDQLIPYLDTTTDKFHLGDILHANLTNNLDPERTPFSSALQEIRSYWVDTENTLTVNGLLMILTAKGLQAEVKKVTQLESSRLFLLISFKRSRRLKFLPPKKVEFGIILEKPEPLNEKALGYRGRILIQVSNIFLAFSENTRKLAKAL